ncbi:MAG: response regulator [Nitrospirae bacterium]|nr:response regulator [Nitrospirota bacterium]
MTHRLLLAHDSVLTQRIIDSLFTPEGFDVRIVDNSRNVMDEIRSYMPDIALMGAASHGFSWRQLCAELKNDAAVSHIPAMLIGGAFDAVDNDSALAGGASDFIREPFNSEVLIIKVKRLLERNADIPFAICKSLYYPHAITEIGAEASVSVLTSRGAYDTAHEFAHESDAKPEAELAAKKPFEQAAEHLGRYKLLLADDSATIQRVIELMLAPEGYDIKFAENGIDALELIRSYSPDIVIADIELPGLNGYQLCENIKAVASTRNIPVMLLSSAFSVFDRDYAKIVASDDHLIKPFVAADLIEKLKTLLTIKQETMKDKEADAMSETAKGGALPDITSEKGLRESDKKAVEENVLKTIDSELLPYIFTNVRQTIEDAVSGSILDIMETSTKSLLSNLSGHLKEHLETEIRRHVEEFAKMVVKKEVERILSRL